MVTIREAEQGDFKQLIGVYKLEYSAGHILHEEDVLPYLTGKSAVYLVCIDNNAVIGGVGISEIIESSDHSVFKIRHFAVLKDYQKQGVADLLLQELEKRVRTGKIEIYVSEKETPDIEFYMQHGYQIEGELSNHYSRNESCFVLGKTI